MPPHFPELPIVSPDPPRKGSVPLAGFPGLPIVTPDPPRKSQAEKYGSMLYLGGGGLVVILALVGWFTYQVSGMRDVWAAIYILHDSHRPEDERIAAAWTLSRDPRVNQRQRYEMVERQKGLPPLARYLLAESLTAEAAEGDPRAYVLAVARSQGWPDWLRLLLLRPIAYAAAAGQSFPAEPLAELGRSRDPFVAQWATFALGCGGDTQAISVLGQAAGADGPAATQARLLLAATNARGADRRAILDRATEGIREGHPGAALVWAGWIPNVVASPPALIKSLRRIQ